MCRLFGAISPKGVDAAEPFFRAARPFKDFSETNRDGWGIGWYQLGKPKVFKEGADEERSYHFDRVNRINCSIMIAHVRRIQPGENSRRWNVDAQPFAHGDFLFAHNGDMDWNNIAGHLNSGLMERMTSTNESEIFFMLIMQFLKEGRDVVEAIGRAVQIAKEKPYVALNFLLSTGPLDQGGKIYAYRDASCNKDWFSLCWLRKKGAIWISSEPLTEDEWEHLGMGELIKVGMDLKVESCRLD